MAGDWESKISTKMNPGEDVNRSKEWNIHHALDTGTINDRDRDF